MQDLRKLKKLLISLPTTACRFQTSAKNSKKLCKRRCIQCTQAGSHYCAPQAPLYTVRPARQAGNQREQTFLCGSLDVLVYSDVLMINNETSRRSMSMYT